MKKKIELISDFGVVSSTLSPVLQHLNTQTAVMHINFVVRARVA